MRPGRREDQSVEFRVAEADGNAKRMLEYERVAHFLRLKVEPK